MVTRIKGEGTASQASVYQGLAYYSGVSAPGNGLKEQTENVLKQVEALLKANGHSTSNIVNAFAVIAPQADPDAFFTVWNAWLEKGKEPALTVVRAGVAAPALVTLQLYVATGEGIKRHDLPNGAGKLVTYNQVAYFSGQSVHEGRNTLSEQTKAVMGNYDKLLAQFNLKKENILNGNIYVQDIAMQDEYEQVWIGWTYTGHKPAGTMVEGKPVKKEHLLNLNLTFADSPEVLDIPRINPGVNCCRFVKHNQVAYFTGHCCSEPEEQTLYSHTKGVMKRLDNTMQEFGMKRENVIACVAYVKHVEDHAEFEKAFDEWAIAGNAPSCTILGTDLLSEKYLIEFTLTVACE